MAFRISILEKFGQRSQSTLITKGQAVIGAGKDCDLVCPKLGSGTVTISETNGKLTLQPNGIELSHKESSWKNEAKTIGSSANFVVANQQFYATMIINEEPSPRKKSYLATLAICLVWTFLALTIIIPLWLPQKIQSQHVRSKFVLLENNANKLDLLRKKVKDQQKLANNNSQITRDIFIKINEEIEQLAWVFRTNGSNMSKKQLEQLEADLADYEQIINNSIKTEKINLTPLSIDDAVIELIKNTK